MFQPNTNTGTGGGGPGGPAAFPTDFYSLTPPQQQLASYPNTTAPPPAQPSRFVNHSNIRTSYYPNQLTGYPPAAAAPPNPIPHLTNSFLPRTHNSLLKSSGQYTQHFPSQSHQKQRFVAQHTNSSPTPPQKSRARPRPAGSQPQASSIVPKRPANTRVRANVDSSNNTEKDDVVKIRRKLRKNDREKQRRSELNAKFQALCSLLCLGRKTKTEKVTILTEAINLIKSIRAENAELRAEKQEMRAEFAKVTSCLDRLAPADNTYARLVLPNLQRSSLSQPRNEKAGIPSRTVSSGVDSCGSNSCSPLVRNASGTSPSRSGGTTTKSTNGGICPKMSAVAISGYTKPKLEPKLDNRPGELQLTSLLPHPPECIASTGFKNDVLKPSKHEESESMKYVKTDSEPMVDSLNSFSNEGNHIKKEIDIDGKAPMFLDAATTEKGIKTEQDTSYINHSNFYGTTSPLLCSSLDDTEEDSGSNPDDEEISGSIGLIDQDTNMLNIGDGVDLAPGTHSQIFTGEMTARSSSPFSFHTESQFGHPFVSPSPPPGDMMEDQDDSYSQTWSSNLM